MDKKNPLGIILVIVGIIIVIISTTADLTGLGGSPIFGWRQILGTVGGAIAFLYGLKLTYRKTE